MTISLSNSSAQPTAPEQAAIAAAAPTVPAQAVTPAIPAVQGAAVPADVAPKGGLLDDVWSRFAQIFGAAANAADADAHADIAAAAPTEVPASDDQAADDSVQDADMPAMALPMLPVVLNLPMAPNLHSITRAPLLGGGRTADDASSSLDSVAASGAARPRDTGGQEPNRVPLNLAMLSAAHPDTSSLSDAGVNPAALTTRSNIRTMAEASLAAADSRAGSSRDPAATATSNAGERTAAGGLGASAVSSNANANLWSSPVAANNTGAVQVDTLKLAGTPSQWQQPLREALGERLQMQLGRNSEQAVIRLDPPMLGRIEISIRHEAGALQVNMSASNNEVLRQLHGIGDSLRQDLSHRQYTEVAVVVTAVPRSNAGSNSADADGRQRQAAAGREQDDKLPGRALGEAEQTAASFAMLANRD